MIGARVGLHLAVPAIPPMFVGGLIGNAGWSVFANSSIGMRLRGVQVIRENDDEPGLFDGDKAARRREIAERWAKGKRLDED